MTKMKARYVGGFQTECTHSDSGAKLVTDIPKELEPSGGKGFSPTDLVPAALASCILTTMALRAKKAGIDFKDAEISIEKQMASAPNRRIGKMIVRFRSSQSFKLLEREMLERAALECPVHASLHPSIEIEMDFVWGV